MFALGPALNPTPLRLDGRGGFRPASSLVDAWLAAQREPFRWFQRLETLPGWMSRLGNSVVAHVGRKTRRAGLIEKVD